MKPGIVVRLLGPADFGTATDIVNAAYPRPFSEHYVERTVRFQPDGWLIAELDGFPAGIGGVTGYGNYAVVGLVATLPKFQHSGVATAILERLMEIADELGCRTIGLDATAAGVALYGRLGFVEVDRTNVWGRPHMPRCCTQPVGVEILGAGCLDEVVGLDAHVFGALRIRLLKQLLEENPGRAFMVRSGANRISGYLIAQPARLGPGAARGNAEAEALVAAALRLDFESNPHVLLPAANRAGSALLERLGFGIDRSTTHMRRGPNLQIGERRRSLGLASFALG